jgi:hypothetical protein
MMVHMQGDTRRAQSEVSKRCCHLIEPATRGRVFSLAAAALDSLLSMPWRSHWQCFKVRFTQNRGMHA